MDNDRTVHLPLNYIAIHCDDVNNFSHRPYGLVMWEAWQKCHNDRGLLWIEGDVAIEPVHLLEVERSIASFPGSVIAVPYRLYPASTHNDYVQWPFYIATKDGDERILKAGEDVPLFVKSFGLGCTWLPVELFNAIGDRIKDWDWPSLDWRLSIVARGQSITIVTTETPAVHLHY